MVGNFLSAALGHYRSVADELADRLEGHGWSVVRTSGRRGRLAKLIDMLLTAWRRRRDYAVAQLDVYSGPAFVWAEAVTWLLRRLGKPYVLTLHGGNLPGYARRRPARVRRLLGSARLVTTPSRYLLEQMAAYHDDLRLLPNPLDIARYPFVPRTGVRPRLVWLRAFEAPYNAALAARVLDRLRDEFPTLRLTMVGPDKGDGSLTAFRQVVRDLDLGDRVEVPGGVPFSEVPDWLNQGDIFINTTNIDNTPVSVMQAMACGLCIVSTNVGGLPYLLEDEQTALLVPPDDAAAMAAAVRRVLTGPELAGRLSREARAAVEPYDWGALLPRWDEILTALVEDRTL
jgi:glycosyltransferase involved in cell wall biosynthesis